MASPSKCDAVLSAIVFLSVTAGALCVPACLAQAKTGVRKSQPSRSWSLANRHVRIALSPVTKGGLATLTDARTGTNFIAGRVPLYRLLLSQNGKELVELSSTDARSMNVEHSVSLGTEMLTLTYGRHRSLDIRVVCRVSLEADSPLGNWRISIENNTPYGVRAIQYPVVQSPLVLGSSSEDDYAISPRGGGVLVPKPGQNGAVSDRPQFRADGGRGANWLPEQYPGLISVQMQAYYDRTAGLYLATYDGGGNIKHFGYTRLRDGLDVSIEHNYDERPGLSFELPYDTVVGVFHGDWYQAADLYKQWAVRQAWASKKITERTDLPGWLKEPRPTLLYEASGDYQRVRSQTSFPPSDYPYGKLWPAKKIVPLTRRYASIFGTPVVVWYNGFEKIGDPCGPVDILPPLEGEQSFKAAMAELRRDGYHPFMAMWGLHWCYKRSMIGYDGWARYEREGRPMAALSDRGEERRYVIGNMEKLFVPVCVGSDDSKRLFGDWFRQLMDLGAVALEFDHQIGGYATVCYSDKHSHPPGYGPWMYTEMLEFIRTTRETNRKRNKDSTLSVEGMGETWIQEMDFMLNRPYGQGGIPLFTYLYHEFIPLLGGDARNGLSHPETELMLHAANFAYGNQSWVMVGHNDYDFEANPDYPIFSLLRNIFQAQRTYARPYVVLGQMLRPARVSTSTVKVDIWLPPGKEVIDPPTAEVPVVMGSVWRGPEGKTGYVLVNWTGESQEAVVELLKKADGAFVVTPGQRTKVPGAMPETGRIRTVIPPRSVVLVEHE